MDDEVACDDEMVEVVPRVVHAVDAIHEGLENDGGESESGNENAVRRETCFRCEGDHEGATASTAEAAMTAVVEVPDHNALTMDAANIHHGHLRCLEVHIASYHLHCTVHETRSG